MALSDLTVRQARTTGKRYTISDNDCLGLLVSAAGGKSWVFRYYWLGKQKRMSLGGYPALSLREARAERDKAQAAAGRGALHRERDGIPVETGIIFVDEDSVEHAWLLVVGVSDQRGRLAKKPSANTCKGVTLWASLARSTAPSQPIQKNAAKASVSAEAPGRPWPTGGDRVCARSTHRKRPTPPGRRPACCRSSDRTSLWVHERLTRPTTSWLRSPVSCDCALRLESRAAHRPRYCAVEVSYSGPRLSLSLSCAVSASE